MKPQELRIGNSIEYFIPTDNLGWQQTTIDWQDLRLCSDQNESFNKCHRGILISEKLLFDFGFEYNDFYKRFKHPKAPIYFLKHPNGSGKLICFLHSCSHANIVFAHLLQNLFFDVTGNELEVKQSEF